MKKLILISALLFSFNGWAEDQGLMLCEIKSMGIEQIEDGKPKSYTNIKGREKVGDVLHFTYEADSINKLLTIVLKHPQNENALYYSRDFPFTALEFDAFDTLFTYQGKYVEYSFGKDFIRINDRNELRMRRYYKSDWQGIFTDKNDGEEGIYYFTFDCRHSIDLIDEVYDTILKDAKIRSFTN